MPDASSSVPFLRYWRGEGRLWVVYWLWGVLPSLLLAAAYWLALTEGEPWEQQVVLLAFALHTAWIVVAVWRCALNVDNPLWGHLARALTVAWAINALLVFLFLELGYVSRTAA